MQEDKIKILVSSLTATPSPFYLLRDMVSRKFGFLEFLRKKSKALKEFDVKFLAEDMYDGLELNFPGLGLFDEDWNVNKIRILDYKKSGYPFLSFHGCYDSFSKSYKGLYFNLASSDDYVVKALKSQIDVASILGQEKPILVLHPGFVDHCGKEKAIDNLLYNLESCLIYAKNKGVVVTLENIGWDPAKRTLCNFVEDFEYIRRRLGNENLKITLDLGHLFTQALNWRFRKKWDVRNLEHVRYFIESLAGNIVHAHLHYNSCHHYYNNISVMLRRSLTRWYYVVFLLWSRFNKSVQKNYYNDLLDEHLPINRADKKSLAIIKILLEKSAIKDYGKITFEFTPKRVFRFVAVKSGAEMADHLASLRLLRGMMAHSNVFSN